MAFTKGQRVEYAAHPVSAISHGDDVDKHIVERVAAIGDEFLPHAEVEEDWRPAVVISVGIHPGQPGIVAETEVAYLQPDGEPPIHINSALVRSL